MLLPLSFFSFFSASCAFFSFVFAVRFFLFSFFFFFFFLFFFFSSRRRHTRSLRDWSSDVCSSDLALALRTQHPDRKVTLVSKDINLRIKAAIVGVHTEDYYNDQVLDDLELLPTGYATLPADFWQTHGEKMESWQDKKTGESCYRLKGPLVKDWYPNQFLFLPDDAEKGLELVVQ